MLFVSVTSKVTLPPVTGGVGGLVLAYANDCVTARSTLPAAMLLHEPSMFDTGVVPTTTGVAASQLW